MQFIAIARLVIKIILFAVYTKRALDVKLSAIKGFRPKSVRVYDCTYNEIRDSLETCDIVLFSGSGFISWMIKFITGSEWSHVGIIQRNTKNDPVLILESTTMSNIRDISSGKVRSGVQLNALGERIKNYKGTVAIVKIGGDLPANAKEKFEEFREKVRDLPYEKSFVQLFKSAYDGAFGKNNNRDFSSLFCSELVAAALQHVGIMYQHTSPSEYVPADFDPSCKKLTLKDGAYLSDIKYVIA